MTSIGLCLFRFVILRKPATAISCCCCCVKSRKLNESLGAFHFSAFQQPTFQLPSLVAKKKCFLFLNNCFGHRSQVGLPTLVMILFLRFKSVPFSDFLEFWKRVHPVHIKRNQGSHLRRIHFYPEKKDGSKLGRFCDFSLRPRDFWGVFDLIKIKQQTICWRKYRTPLN